MASTVVDRLHADFEALVTFLDDGAEPSLRSTAEETFRKALLLSAASHFEARITDVLITFVRDTTHPATPIPEFVRNKAVSRQYHTLFDWEATNANRFFSLFGEGFKQHMQGIVKRDPALGQAVEAFLEVGRERNRLVHTDYGTFALEKTAAEIFELFTKGVTFVDRLRFFLDTFVADETARAPH
jgi:hypothetical protein